MKKVTFRMLVLGACSLFMGIHVLSCQAMGDFGPLPANAARVSYIANAGFLIESTQHKILIDALFTEGWNSYVTPSKDILEKMVNGEAPFDGVKVLFISHEHDDHFSPWWVSKFLEKDPSRYVVCSNVTNGKLENHLGSELYQTYKDRIKNITPEPYSSLSSSIEGLEFKVISLRHSGGWENDGNIGFVINMDGINVFHGGDSDGYLADGQTVSGYEEYSRIGFSSMEIDLGIIGAGMFWESQAPGIEIIKNIIKPKFIVMKHLSKNDAEGEWDRVLGVIEANKQDIPNVFILKKSMDKKTFTY